MGNDTESKFKKIRNVVSRFFHGLVEILVRAAFKIIYGKGESMPPIKDLLLLESATAIAHKIRTKKITSEKVLDSFIARIEEINPILNCVVDKRFDEARVEAKKADAFIASGVKTESELAKEKPFLGVPFTTKDCIAVKGLFHTAGIHHRRGFRAEEDSESIALLRKAGAIPIALSNVSELCMWWESNNPVHGRTNNPYDVNRMVGGSSGGEGCLQAAAGSAFGIGSDIGGSIRIPCFMNGIFGHKPSPKIVSNIGQFPRPSSDEQNIFLGIGPMCRRAEDLIPIYKILAGNNADLLKLDEPVDITKIKYYYQESDQGGRLVSPVDKDIRLAMRKVITHLEKAHKMKPEKTMFSVFSKSVPMWLSNMKAENSPTFPEHLANHNGSINVGFEFMKWFIGKSNHTLIALITAVVERWGVQYDTPKYHHFVSERNKMKLQLLDLLGDDGVFIYPTHPTAAPYHNEALIKPLNFGYTAIFNVLGLPSTHCPLGLGSEGLPIGIQVVAAPNQDRLCLAVALELEKAFGGWVPPQVDA